MSQRTPGRHLIWAAALSLLGAGAAEAASSIAVMPFDYSRRVRASTNFTRTGPNGGTWVIKTSDNITIEFETHEFTNKLITSLVKENKFEVVERKKLDRLIEEQKLSASALVDPERAVQAGKLLGADYFVMAEISVYEASARYQYFKPIDRWNRYFQLKIVVDYRVVDTAKGKIVFADKAEASREKVDKAIRAPTPVTISGAVMDEVQRELCKNLVRKLVDNVFPIKVIRWSSGIAYLNRGSNGGVQAGQVFKVFEQGEELIDEDTGLRLGAEETAVAVIRVTDAQKKFSKAELVQWIGANQTINNGSICRPFDGKVAPPPPPRDTTPPTVVFLSPKAGQTLSVSPVNAVVECRDPDVARIVINGVTASPLGEGRFKAAVKASEGANTFRAEAYDQAGNCGVAQVAFNFDSQAPDVSAAVTVVVRGKVDDPKSTVTINGQPVAVQADGSYELEVKLGPDRKVVIVATDEFGNSKRIVRKY